MDRIDTLDDFIIRSGLIDVRDDNEFELVAIFGEDFLEVLSFFGGPSCTADVVALIEKGFNDPDSKVAVRAGDEDRCGGGYGWHCEVGFGVGLGGRCTLVERSKMSRERRPNLYTGASYYDALLFTGCCNQRVSLPKAHDP